MSRVRIVKGWQHVYTNDHTVQPRYVVQQWLSYASDPKYHYWSNQGYFEPGRLTDAETFARQLSDPAFLPAVVSEFVDGVALEQA
jgi:hypothetical protein